MLAEVQRRILSRLLRVEVGNYGDFKQLQEGIFELRFHFDAGYRVYFGEEKNNIVLLLCVGDKHTQSRDIQKAIEYLKEYKGKHYD